MIAKRGQSGSNAAIMLIIITVVMILYILFLPPGDRAELLSDDNETGTGSTSTTKILLDEKVGKLTYVKNDDQEYDLPSFTVNTQTKGEIIKAKTSAYIKNSLFDDIQDTTTFNTNPELSENLMLSFNIEKAEGRLRVELNGNTIFNDVLKEGNSPPIYLDKAQLESKNALTISVSSPGLAFWRYNEYSIKDIKITGDITDISDSHSIQSFQLTQKDIENQKETKLRYLPVCTEQQVLNFEILLNSERLFRGIPDCGVYNFIPISKASLKPGSNNLEFNIDEGSVLVDRLRLTNTLEEPEHPVYYFDLEYKYFTSKRNGSEFEYNLWADKYNVTIDFTFPNDDQKKMEVFINGRKIGINIAQRSYSRDISGYMRPETNSLEIRPLNDFTITQMKVRLKRK